MGYPKIPLYLFKECINPEKWYEYRELVKILPISSSSIVRLLSDTPHIVVYKSIIGSKVQAPRPVRLFPGVAIIETAEKRFTVKSKTSSIPQHEDRGDVPTETEEG